MTHPLLLKRLIMECDIQQADLAKATGTSRATISRCINHNYLPHTLAQFRTDVETYLQSPGIALQVRSWLTANKLQMSDIWSTGDQPVAKPHTPEVEMVHQDTLRHFKMFRNPFVADIEKSADIYKSDEHRYIEAAMFDTAKHGGFLAVIGEVGSGKTTMRREVMEQLKKESNVMVIFPQIIDKTRINASSICDAIVMDLSEERPKLRLEQKTRQVQKLLMDRSRAGYQACLIIEEAHDLSTQTLKYLKRFYELEDGYKKLLGIILVGQTELKHMFNESQHVEMREVIRRVQVAEIRGLDGNLKDYLNVKFKRVGAKIEDIIDDEAIAALARRLTTDEGKGKKSTSHAYPLLVNNYTARAMNLTAEMGETKITADVVEAL
jgi:type II secretory pathway predicted ATPase ExeA